MKPTLARIVTSLAAVGLLLAAGPAEARFGKSSDDGDGKGAKSSRSTRSSDGKASSSNTHAATAVGKPPPRSHGGRSRGHRHHRTRVVVRPPVVVGHAHIHDPYCGHSHYVHEHHHHAPAPPPAVVTEPEPAHEHRHRFEFFGYGQPMLNGGVLSANMRLEWDRLGMDLRYDHLSLLAEDGSGSFDRIQLFDATMSAAIFRGEHGRVRGHFGLYSAFAPDVTFVGPGGGLSASVNLFGPFTAEAAGHLVLVPFTKVDTWAGLGLRIGALEGRAGMRFTVLDDQGRVDGVVHRDVMAGPYIGVGLVL